MAKFNIDFSEKNYKTLVDMSHQLDQSMADVIREALKLYGFFIRETSQGNTILIKRGDRAPVELVIFGVSEETREPAERKRDE